MQTHPYLELLRLDYKAFHFDCKSSESSERHLICELPARKEGQDTLTRASFVEVARLLGLDKVCPLSQKPLTNTDI
jgi:hypothetical protein